MTPKERMVAALEGRKPECVPVAPYFWGEEYVWKLMGKPVWQVSLGPTDTWKEIIRAVQDRHDCDWVIRLGNGNGFLEGKQVEERDGRVIVTDPAAGRRWEYLMDGRRVVELDEQSRPMSEEAKTTGVLHGPITTTEQADRWLETHGYGPPEEDAATVERRPDWLVQDYGDRYLTAAAVGGGFHPLCYALGLETALVMMVEAPRVAAYMLERFMAGVPRHARELAAAGYDAGYVVDSYASADIVSPRMYADWIAPIHRAHAQAIKQAGLKAILYNTGNILPLLSTMKRLGFDALSFEERIKGVEMDIAAVRRAVGPGLCLFGNFDSYLLLRGDREAISREVARQIRAAGRDGAFIMGTGSPICDATDPEVVDFWIAETRRFAA